MQLQITISSLIWFAVLAISYWLSWWILFAVWICHPVIAIGWAVRDSGIPQGEDWNVFWSFFGMSLVPVWNTTMFIVIMK